MFSVSVFAQLSPGKLTKAHSNLEGLSNCTNCHILGKGVDEVKCLDCHKEIKRNLQQNSGFHSTEKVKEQKCWNCHSEHHGRKFRIVNFNKDNFNHSSTGFDLLGSHKKTDCEKCHTSKNISDVELKKRAKTFLGLSTDCVSCHEDVHKNTLGKDCSSCHNNDKFNPAEKFDHNKAKFKLTGSHVKTDCIKCHPVSGSGKKKFQKFKNIQFSSCLSCHKDFHKGKFGNDCTKCHNTSSFKNIDKNSFDHSKTDFKLLGKHSSVKCEDCHKNGIKVKLNYSKCTDCHKDYHNGEFKKQGVLTDCSKCHTVNGFSPSLFTLELHEKTKFKLTGSHLALPCINCHKKEKDWHFKNIGINCIDCHKNIHGKEISFKFLGNNECTKCHNTESWTTISFEHDKTDFKLLGKHNKVSCESCHKNKKTKEIKFIFSSLKSECVTCHKDIHLGQFDESGITKCERCHTFNNWQAEKFNHEKTKFSLKGGHEKLVCSACHKKMEKNNISYINFKLEAFKCADCHLQ